MRTLVMLIATLCLIGACRTGSESAGKETRARLERHAESYRHDGDYQPLKWLSENFLEEGMSLAKVEATLGASESAAGDGPGEDTPNSSRKYYSDRNVPYGHILIIHVADGKVDGWEWASE